MHDLHYKLIVLRSVGLRSENSTLSLLRSLQMRIKVADQFALPRSYRFVKFKGSWYLKRRRHGNVALWDGHEGMRKSAHGRMKSLANITVAHPGEGPGGLDPIPLVFRPNWGPKGRNIFFFETGPPPFSQGVDDRPTPHLPIWRSATALLMFVFKKHTGI